MTYKSVTGHSDDLRQKSVSIVYGVGLYCVKIGEVGLIYIDESRI